MKSLEIILNKLKKSLNGIFNNIKSYILILTHLWSTFNLISPLFLIVAQTYERITNLMKLNESKIFK
jgi:hypothetical protein